MYALPLLLLYHTKHCYFFKYFNKNNGFYQSRALEICRSSRHLLARDAGRRVDGAAAAAAAAADSARLRSSFRCSTLESYCRTGLAASGLAARVGQSLPHHRQQRLAHAALLAGHREARLARRDRIRIRSVRGARLSTRLAAGRHAPDGNVEQRDRERLGLLVLVGELSGALDARRQASCGEGAARTRRAPGGRESPHRAHSRRRAAASASASAPQRRLSRAFALTARGFAAAGVPTHVCSSGHCAYESLEAPRP